jgi:hypothetical protein
MKTEYRRYNIVYNIVFVVLFVGSGFYIKGRVSYFRPQIILQPVDHHDNNELHSYNGKPELVETYCPYPVPSYYELVNFRLKVGEFIWMEFLKLFIVNDSNETCPNRTLNETESCINRTLNKVPI